MAKDRKQLETNWSILNLSEEDGTECLVVNWVNSLEDYSRVNAFDLIDIDNAVLLEHPEAGSQTPLKIMLEADSGYSLAAVTIISESRTVEAYCGKFEEYLFTSKAIQHLDREDIVMSVVSMRMEKPCEYLTLKLSKLSEPRRCMLFAVLVCREIKASPAPSTSLTALNSSINVFERIVDEKVKACESRLLNSIFTKLDSLDKERTLGMVLEKKLDGIEERLNRFIEEKIGALEQELIVKVENILAPIAKRIEMNNGNT
ncbi:uncharacterized protein LOC136043986 isoform X2 [Artemia franciscana]|nr:hypothetical protein QYM36_009896 [Artemia franciscana]